ncbi:hypothetical protein ACH4TP_38120 [Streptomyces sp. NPDC021012]|uniref:hypothetical protein n=1 Tax=Streptomyces sp. NPDC021012 TaxID=3365107 RepID=UPI0037A9D645
MGLFPGLLGALLEPEPSDGALLSFEGFTGLGAVFCGAVFGAGAGSVAVVVLSASFFGDGAGAGLLDDSVFLSGGAGAGLGVERGLFFGAGAFGAGVGAGLFGAWTGDGFGAGTSRGAGPGFGAGLLVPAELVPEGCFGVGFTGCFRARAASATACAFLTSRRLIFAPAPFRQRSAAARSHARITLSFGRLPEFDRFPAAEFASFSVVFSGASWNAALDIPVGVAPGAAPGTGPAVMAAVVMGRAGSTGVSIEARKPGPVAGGSSGLGIAAGAVSTAITFLTLCESSGYLPTDLPPRKNLFRATIGSSGPADGPVWRAVGR